MFAASSVRNWKRNVCMLSSISTAAPYQHVMCPMTPNEIACRPNFESLLAWTYLIIDNLYVGGLLGRMFRFLWFEHGPYNSTLTAPQSVERGYQGVISSSDRAGFCRKLHFPSKDAKLHAVSVTLNLTVRGHHGHQCPRQHHPSHHLTRRCPASPIA